MTKDSTYTAVIIEDEEKIRAVIQAKLARHCPEVDVIGQAGDAVRGAEMIKELNPQIIFLDVAMPKGTGFDMLSRLGPISSEVIFITGYNEYVLRALRLSAVDYLLKPLVDMELVAAVAKAKKRIDDMEMVSDYKLLQHNADHHHDQSAKLSIPGANGYDQVTISDIIRCEGDQRYTRVYLVGGKKLMSSYNIGVFRDLLAQYDFYPIHKSHLINQEHLMRYLTEGTVVMTDGSQAPVSRRRREEFKSCVLRLIAAGKSIDTD